MVEPLPAPENLCLPKADDIIPIVQGWIDGLGVEEAFKVVGTILLYSGPRETIYERYRKFAESNHEKVIDLIDAADKPYTLLDKTGIGEQLQEYGGKGVDLYQHLKDLYKKEYCKSLGAQYDKVTEKKVEGLASAQANLVMRHVSKAFIDAAHGDVETCVCGADLEKIFFTVELPALMDNKRITAINGVDIEEFRKVYFSGKPHAAYDTFKMICEAELEMTHANALATSGKKAVLLMDDHNSRKMFFDMEQRERAEELRKTVLASVTTTLLELEEPVPARPGAGSNVTAAKRTCNFH